jgi:hypothetical protein
MPALVLLTEFAVYLFIIGVVIHLAVAWAFSDPGCQ